MADFLADAEPVGSDALDGAEPIVGLPDRKLKPPTGPTEISAAPGPVVQGAEEAARTGAFIAGETGGAAAGALTSPVTGPAGPAAGSAVGAGITATTMDAIIAYANHYKYGTPIDVSKRAVLEDFLTNAGASVGGAVLGKVATGAIPAEATAVKDAVDKAQQVKSGMTEKLAAQGKAGMERLEQQQESQLGKISPQAQLESITATTGRTAETAAKSTLPEMGATADGAITAPSPETLAKQGGPRGAYFAVKNRLGDAYGAQYEKILGPYQNNKIDDLSGIQGTLDKWENIYATEGRTATGPIKTLIEDAQKIAPKSFVDRAAASVSRLTPMARSAAERVETAQGSTVSRVLALKRAAQKMMVGSTDDRSRQIAEEIADSANETLGKAGGLPDDVRQKIGGLNTQYADYKRMFPRTDISKMATAQTPIEAADRLFGNPTLAERVVANAKPEEKKALQESFGDWASLHPDKLLAEGKDRASMKADALIKSRVYGRLFPNSPLADPNSIMYVGATMQNIEQAPGMKKLFDSAMQKAQQDSVTEGSKAVRDMGVQAAKELHLPALAGDIQAANLKGGPTAAAQVATKYFTNMTPDKFVQSLAENQKWAGPSLAKTIAKPADENKMKYWMQRLMENPSAWPLLAGYGAFNYLGHGSVGFMGAIGLAGTVPVGRRLMANAFVKGLEDRELATALLNGTKAARLGAMYPLATTLMKGASDEVGSRLIQRGTGVTLEPEQDESEDEGEAATP